MAFATKLLRDLSEADFLGLIGLPEGMALEFKQELKLGTVEQKREAAKDVSALANSIGGRVIYGMAERKATDGSKVASKIMPLTDGRLATQLTDTLHAYIEPRVLQLDVRAIPVTGGDLLVVEVPTPRGLDLHMVANPAGGAFYRRGPIGNIPMAENEIRESYTRIAERRSSLAERVEGLMRSEAMRRGNCDGSFFVVPVHSRPNLVDPRRFPRLGLDLYHGVLTRFELKNWVMDLAIMHDGFRWESRDEQFRPSSRYLAIQKTGVIHWSTWRLEPSNGQALAVGLIGMALNLVQTLVLSRWVLREAGYFGDLQLRYMMHRPNPWFLTDVPMPPKHVPAGDYQSSVATFDPESGPESWALAVKELVDPFFHAAGVVASPYFSPAGYVRRPYWKAFAPFSEYLVVDPNDPG